MKTTQLAYSKVILSKVSFSETLFGKELRKSIHELAPAERLDLYAWCSLHFGAQYPAVLAAVFSREFAALPEAAGAVPPVTRLNL
ncbi:MAG: hypothetical protein ICV83_21740 [Cytophagales bacterium]|nr:hypothetical protein [Cytophagales bacterium]